VKKILILFFMAALISSCSKSMYSWCDYEKTSYNYYKKQTPQATNALIETYRNMIENASKSKRKVVPPGMYAEYGYLLIQNGQKKLGLFELKKEIETYPESATYINRIIKLSEQ